MKINFKDKNLEKKYNYLYISFYSNLSEHEKKLVNIVSIRYKKICLDEYYLYFISLYWLLFFKKIDLNSRFIDDKDRESFYYLYDSFRLEIEWNHREFLYSILAMPRELSKIKNILKFCLISFDKELLPLVSKNINYIKSIWYIIPMLTYNDSWLLPFYQDYYFKRLYKSQYKETEKYYKDRFNNIWYKWSEFIIISTVNDINKTFLENNITWRLDLRKKSLFSIYNKLKRKGGWDVLDIIWVRVIFPNIDFLYKFLEDFENKNIYIKKKDFITNPKENWYQSIHYNYINTYKDCEISIELQLRTEEMDRNIKEKLSHYDYTLNKNKWNEEFREVYLWHKYLEEFIPK